jgi:hypothetical protein
VLRVCRFGQSDWGLLLAPARPAFRVHERRVGYPNPVTPLPPQKAPQTRWSCHDWGVAWSFKIGWDCRPRNGVPACRQLGCRPQGCLGCDCWGHKGGRLGRQSTPAGGCRLGLSSLSPGVADWGGARSRMISRPFGVAWSSPELAETSGVWGEPYRQLRAYPLRKPPMRPGLGPSAHVLRQGLAGGRARCSRNWGEVRREMPPPVAQQHPPLTVTTQCNESCVKSERAVTKVSFGFVGFVLGFTATESYSSDLRK